MFSLKANFVHLKLSLIKNSKSNINGNSKFKFNINLNCNSISKSSMCRNSKSNYNTNKLIGFRMKMSFQFEYTDFFEFKMKIQLYYVKCYIALMTLNLK